MTARCALGEGGWATTRSLQVPGQRTGSVHPTEKLCSHFLLNPKNIAERARGQEGWWGVGGWVRTSCRDTHINTNCIKHTTSGKASALGVPRKEVLWIRVLYALGPAVQGRSSRAPSPAVPPAFDPDHALPHALSSRSYFAVSRTHET